MSKLHNRQAAQGLDETDALKELRHSFSLPDGVIYLDGNSLGPMAKTVGEQVRHAVEVEWAKGLISSWNDAGWWDLSYTLGDKIAPLVGSKPGQTVVSDSTSINLYKAVMAALALRPGRGVIVSELESFPTDLYMLEGITHTNHSLERRLIGADGDCLDDVLNDDVAVVLLSNVNFRTGALMDIRAVTEKVHAAGAVVVWDLCHSAGVIPMQLDDWNVDFAVGCTYKYLNGGPGAPSFIYAPKRLHPKIRQPLSGWWGHSNPFAFKADYEPAEGIGAFLCGSQPIVSMTALSAALDVYKGIDIESVRAKSIALTEYFIELVEGKCPELTVVSPKNPQLRGSQVALTHEHGFAMMQALIARGVIGDFRAPDVLRFGFGPLYIRFTDVWDGVAHLRDILDKDEWREERFNVRSTVT